MIKTTVNSSLLSQNLITDGNNYQRRKSAAVGKGQRNLHQSYIKTKYVVLDADDYLGKRKQIGAGRGQDVGRVPEVAV